MIITTPHTYAGSYVKRVTALEWDGEQASLKTMKQFLGEKTRFTILYDENTEKLLLVMEEMVIWPTNMVVKPLEGRCFALRRDTFDAIWREPENKASEVKVSKAEESHVDEPNLFDQVQ